MREMSKEEELRLIEAGGAPMSLRRRSGGGGGGGGGTSGGATPRRSTPHSMLHSMAAGAGSARPTGRETRSLAASRGRGSTGSAGLGSTGVG